MAAVYLAQAFGDGWNRDLDIPFVRQLDHPRWNILAQMIIRGINSPLTSSLGRLFDAVAALIGLRNNVLYEGQAAIELEALASTVQTTRIQRCYPFEINGQMDVAPLIRAIVEDLQQGMALPQIAWNFHRSIAELLATACLTIREQSRLQVVALSGGVFQNRLLLEQLMARLREMAFRVYINQRVPPNDGGISFGQIAVAKRIDCSGRGCI
jgi:hydrogenase maturation protein HypF